MKVRIKYGDIIRKDDYPFGHYSAENRQFLIALRATQCEAVFEAESHNMNYVRLPNGFLVHVYHCHQVMQPPSSWPNAYGSEAQAWCKHELEINKFDTLKAFMMHCMRETRGMLNPQVVKDMWDTSQEA